MFKHELKKVAADKITGFTGIITVRADYLTGPKRYCLECKHPDGKVSSEWFDEERLVCK